MARLGVQMTTGIKQVRLAVRVTGGCAVMPVRIFGKVIVRLRCVATTWGWGELTGCCCQVEPAGISERGAWAWAR